MIFKSFSIFIYEDDFVTPTTLSPTKGHVNLRRVVSQNEPYVLKLKIVETSEGLFEIFPTLNSTCYKSSSSNVKISLK